MVPKRPVVTSAALFEMSVLLRHRDAAALKLLQHLNKHTARKSKYTDATHKSSAGRLDTLGSESTPLLYTECDPGSLCRFRAMATPCSLVSFFVFDTGPVRARAGGRYKGDDVALEQCVYFYPPETDEGKQQCRMCLLHLMSLRSQGK